MAARSVRPGQDTVLGREKQGGVRQHETWAKMLGSTLPNRLNKNILEIVLEKDEKGAFNVSDQDCIRVMRKIGLEITPGVQVEEIQICPNGRGIILITLRDGVPLGPFCRYDVFEVSSSGIRAVNVKPAGKSEVVVTVRGLHPNTRDEGVIDYLGKFGKVVTTKVVHCTFGDGPLKGFKNGDRCYKMEVKPDSNIGSYHILDGNKVTVRYRGQQQTCARCHEIAPNCAGGAIARRCEANGGAKVEISDHILELWRKIGYTPGAVEIAAVYDDHGEDVDEDDKEIHNIANEFTPIKVISEPDKFAGVSVKQFPKETDPGDIVEFLVMSGLPEVLKDSVVIKPNGTVTVRNLENDICLKLISNIHNKKHFNRKLFCNGIIPLTPEKPSESQVSDDQEQVSSAGCGASAPRSQSPCTPPPALTATAATPASLSQTCPVSQPTFHELLHGQGAQVSGEDLIRRHSLSLRTPPHGSLADEILKTGPSSLLKSQAMLNELKDQLSEFGSCLSSFSGSSSDGENSSVQHDGGSPKADSHKRKSKRKRKSSNTPPGRNYFLKKANAASSPEQVNVQQS